MEAVNTVPKLIIAGIIVLSALGILYATFRLFVTSKSKARIKGIEVDASGEVRLPCIDYVKSHSDMLESIGKTLEKMETQRGAARAESSESRKATQVMIKHLLTSQDAMLEAMQKVNIGNGNIEKARIALASCYNVQDKYLIDQL
jgi:hypothetical protein